MQYHQHLTDIFPIFRVPRLFASVFKYCLTLCVLLKLCIEFFQSGGLCSNFKCPVMLSEFKQFHEQIQNPALAGNPVLARFKKPESCTALPFM